MDVFHDPASESILVHELTHWLQQANSSHPVAQTCQEWLDREYQAYDVQYRWLRDSSPNVRSFSIQMAKLNHTALVVRCPSTGAGQAAIMGDSPLACRAALDLPQTCHWQLLTTLKVGPARVMIFLWHESAILSSHIRKITICGRSSLTIEVDARQEYDRAEGGFHEKVDHSSYSYDLRRS